MRKLSGIRDGVSTIVFALGMVGCAGGAISEKSASNDVISKAHDLYQKHCQSCHGENRIGGSGPALFPENLGRLKPEEASKVIREGRPLTQMASFHKELNEQEIQMLVDFIYQPSSQELKWGFSEIEGSLISYPYEVPSKPQFKSDPLNLFMVVESGDHHVTVLDGDRFEPLIRFPSRYALHGGIKYSPDGRYAYMASRDGWVTMFDIYALKVVREVRAAINTRNLAISDDGKTLAVGNYLPKTVVLLDGGTLKPIQVLDAVSKSGGASRVSAVYTAPPRKSFVVALKDVPEVWEIPYGNLIQIIDKNSDKDVQGGQKTVSEISHLIRRMGVEDVLDDFFFDGEYRHLIGASRGGETFVLNLQSGKTIKRLSISGMPHLGSGIEWSYHGRKVFATPNLKEGAITVVDTSSWSILKKISTEGPGFFLRSHENSPYAWSEVFFGPNKDLVHVIDKRTLKIAKTLKPRPQKTSGHVEFTRDGKYALVSIWEEDGELLIYDAKTLELKKSLPMKKPSGKYNVYNKITYAQGTSH